MTHLILLGLNLAAITLLVFGLYFPRHRRRDLIVAFIGVNLGVLVVSGALSSTAVGAGLGLGLLGVLSIIRLRSSELEQHEIAYYFSALALGLLGGVSVLALWQHATLMGLVLLGVFVGDHPRLFRRYRTQAMVLDRAFTNETRLIAHLEGLLQARVHRVSITRVDLVNETTWVNVRYEVPETTPVVTSSSAAVQSVAEVPAR